jgi:uncharacterized protein (TIGR03437 family)
MRTQILCVLALAQLAPAQQYLISTIAGGAPPPSPIPATAASIGSPDTIAFDAAGNFYFTGNQCVFKVTANGILTRFAGTARNGYSGDGGPATGAQLHNPFGVAVDAAGNVYIADELNHRIRRVDANGTITTVAGNGMAGFSGDGGPAANAQLNDPLNVLADGSGNLFIADSGNNSIRKVTPDGLIATIAGGGASDPGDGGPATRAVVSAPSGMAIDAGGNLYIADRQNMRVRRIAPGGTISTVAGNGTAGYSGDGGPAVAAQLYLPTTVAVDSFGNLFIADFANNVLREVSSAGVITTVGARTFYEPSGVALDGSGNLYVTDQQYDHVLKVVVSPGIASSVAVAGNGLASYSGDGGPATAAQLSLPSGVAVDASGNIYISDLLNSRVRRVTPGGIIATVAAAPNLIYPGALALDSAGNLYIADTGRSVVLKLSPGGAITTVAGNGTQGYSGDGGPATAAQLSDPTALAVDAAGNLYIADNNRFVRKVSPSGVIGTFAGGGIAGSTAVANTTFEFLSGLAVDASGTVYIATGSYVLKASPSGAIAGVVQVSALGPIALDAAGNIYTTMGGNTIFRISPYAVAAIAGTGNVGYTGDGGPALGAQLYHPEGIAVDAAGNIWFADSFNDAVRVLRPTAQTTVVGAVVDAASEAAAPVSPGKIVVVYGSGLGPPALTEFQPYEPLPFQEVAATQLAGTSVSFNGIPAPVLYTSATQVAVVVPYEITGETALVTVTWQGQTSTPFAVTVAPSAPSLFTANGTGAGGAAAINVAGGTLNDAAHPVRIGDYLSLYATGEGQTTPAGIDGLLATAVLPQPNLPVGVTVGGIPATVQYRGGAPGAVAGLTQVNVRIPPGVTPGGYVPVVLTVGNASTVAGAVWIAVTAP